MKRDINAEDYKSKSQLKRDAEAIQALVPSLLGLSRPVLLKLPLPEHILFALQAGKSMKQGALRRQILLIGKLLRSEDDLSELQRALATYLK